MTNWIPSNSSARVGIYEMLGRRVFQCQMGHSTSVESSGLLMDRREDGKSVQCDSTEQQWLTVMEIYYRYLGSYLKKLVTVRLGVHPPSSKANTHSAEPSVLLSDTFFTLIQSNTISIIPLELV